MAVVKKASKPLTKTQLIAHLAEKSALTKKQISEVLDALLEVAYKEAKKDHGFNMPGLGKLIVVKRKAREGVNPATREKIKIPAKKALKFRIAKAAKDAVIPTKK
jgi:DNA-binding protein HU-beta